MASTEVLYNRGGFYGKQINGTSLLTTYKTISPLHPIGVSTKREFFDKIDSVGTFPDNRIKMDIIFQDSNGNEYVWTPKWEEVMSIYAESERVEEMNLAGGEWLEELKEKKQFSDEVLDELAKTHIDNIDSRVRFSTTDGSKFSVKRLSGPTILLAVSTHHWKMLSERSKTSTPALSP